MKNQENSWPARNEVWSQMSLKTADSLCAFAAAEKPSIVVHKEFNDLR